MCIRVKIPIWEPLNDDVKPNDTMETPNSRNIDYEAINCREQAQQYILIFTGLNNNESKFSSHPSDVAYFPDIFKLLKFLQHIWTTLV